MEPRYNTHTHVSLSASAGSGKTYALTLRLLKMLMEGVPPEHILCTTFTNKATREMAERLMHRLGRLSFHSTADAAEEEEIREDLRVVFEKDSIGEDDLARGRRLAARVRQGLLTSLSRLRISTMDSFFNSILRLFPFESGVTPDFSVMNEAEEQDIFSQAMDAFVKEISGNPRAARLFENLVFSLSNTENDPQLLMKRYFEVLSAARINVQAYCRRRNLDDLTLDGVLRLMEAADSSGKIATEACRDFGRAFMPHSEGLSRTALNMIERCADADSADAVFGIKPFKSAGYRDYRYFSKATDVPELDKAFKGVKKALGEYLEAKSVFAVSALLYFFQMYIRHADLIKRGLRRLSFSDIERLCWDLLVGQDGGSIFSEAGTDFFYYRLDSRLKHLLMDEFQDTNTAQWGVFRPVIMEITADREGSFFYVGDPKQAIYRFRGGESGLFRHVRDTLEGRIVEDSLPVNYRSATGVVSFVNRVFGHISDKYNYDFSPQESNRKDPGIVELIAVDSGGHDDRRAAIDEYVTKHVRHLGDRGLPWNRIAVLMRDNNGCARIADSLISAGIPVSIEGRESLFSSRSVRTVLSLLNFLANNSRESGLLELVSQTGALTEDDEKALRQTAHGSRLEALQGLAPGLYDSIRALMDRMDLTPVKELVAGAVRVVKPGSRFHDRENILKLMDLAGGITEQGAMGLQGFLDDISRYGEAVTQASDAEPHAVQVLTVHKAKGLEFEAVILPQVDDAVRFDKQRSNFMMPLNRSFGLDGIHLTPSKDELGFSAILDEVYAKEMDNTVDDALNLLYVALTRAKTGMFIAGPADIKRKKSGGANNEARITWLSIMLEALGISDIPPHGGKLFSEGRLDDLLAKAAIDAESEEAPARSPEKGRNDSPSQLHPQLYPLPAADGDPQAAEMEEDDDEAHLFRTDPVKRMRAIAYGNAFHFAMEHLPPLMDAEYASHMTLARHGRLLDEDFRIRLRQDIEAVIRHKTLAGILSGGMVHTELPIMSDDMRLMKIDALAILDKRAVVIDYKTHYSEELLDSYRRQVGEYLSIVKTAYGLPVVEGLLVFVDQGIRIESVSESGS